MPSALVVGTFAPDFEYFLRMAPRGGFGHSLLGVFALTLPLELPAVQLLPDGLRRRLQGHLEPFRWSGARRILAIGGSMLLGIGTHVVWDWFTHLGSWLYGRWAFLRECVRLPGLGWVPHYKLLQHGSTVVGLAVLGVWFVGWYRGAEVSLDVRPLSSARRWVMLGLLMAFAVVGAAVRVFVFGRGSLAGVVGQAVCAFVAMAWWGLVGYGVFWTSQGWDGTADSFRE